MDLQHHSRAQVDAAFALAPQILRQLVDAGIPYPHFDLYSDASGTLWLDDNDLVSDEQAKLASDLVRSVRFTKGEKGKLGIQFCCGLVR